MRDQPCHWSVYLNDWSDRDDADQRQRDVDLWDLCAGYGNVPFDPAVNRIFVRFKDGGAVTRGSTSVAVRTQ